MFSVCNGIHGPYLSKNAHGRPVNLNTEWQIELIGRKFIPALRRKRGVDMDTVIYQQVEANSLSAVDGDKLVFFFFVAQKRFWNCPTFVVNAALMASQWQHHA